MVRGLEILLIIFRGLDAINLEYWKIVAAYFCAPLHRSRLDLQRSKKYPRNLPPEDILKQLRTLIFNIHATSHQSFF